jgi:hypothetical protein
MICNTDNDSNSNSYSYHRLENKDDKNETLEMEYIGEKNVRAVNLHKANDSYMINMNNSHMHEVYSLNDATQNNYGHVSSRQVKLVVVSFGIRLLFTALIWDHYVHKYHDLLMEFSNNPTQRVSFFTILINLNI